MDADQTERCGCVVRADLCGCVQVLLYEASGATLGAQTLGADHTSHVFPGLRPGHLYRSEVVTHSGELTNSVSAMGRTCKTTTDVSRSRVIVELM